MPRTCREASSDDASVDALKYALATLIQSVASALSHQLLEHASDRFYSIHQIIQVGKLSLGERSPAFRGASDLAETEEQVSDFSQCKTELTRTQNDWQAAKRCGVVSSLPANSRGPGKHSNSLVIPDRRGLGSNLSRHLGNRQFRHKDILEHVFPVKIRALTASLKQPLALNSTLSCNVIDGATKRPEVCRQEEQ